MSTTTHQTLPSQESSRGRDGLIGEYPEQMTELSGIDLSELDLHALDEFKGYFLAVNHLLGLQADLIVLCEILNDTKDYIESDDEALIESNHDARIQKLWAEGSDLIASIMQLLKESKCIGMCDDLGTVDSMYLKIKILTEAHISLRESVFAFIFVAKVSEDFDWDQIIKPEHLDAVEASTIKCRKLLDFSLNQLAKPSRPNFTFSNGSLIFS